MNAMQQAPPAEPGAVPDAQEMSAAVEEQMGKIVTELGAALGVLLTSLGTRSGLWAALAGAGPLTTAEVAAKVSVEPSLVREWLRAQAAGGYLDYDPATGTFTLPDAVAAAICHGPGGALVDAAATCSLDGRGLRRVQRGVRRAATRLASARAWHGTTPSRVGPARRSDAAASAGLAGSRRSCGQAAGADVRLRARQADWLPSASAGRHGSAARRLPQAPDRRTVAAPEPPADGAVRCESSSTTCAGLRPSPADWVPTRRPLGATRARAALPRQRAGRPGCAISRTAAAPAGRSDGASRGAALRTLTR